MSSTCALSMRKNGPAWTISTQLAIAASRSSTTYAICLMTPCSIAMTAPGLRHANVDNEHTRVADDALLIVAEDGDLLIADRDVGRQQLLPRGDVERADYRGRQRERRRKRERQDQGPVVRAHRERDGRAPLGAGWRRGRHRVGRRRVVDRRWCHDDGCRGCGGVGGRSRA